MLMLKSISSRRLSTESTVARILCVRREEWAMGGGLDQESCNTNRQLLATYNLPRPLHVVPALLSSLHPFPSQYVTHSAAASLLSPHKYQ